MKTSFQSATLFNGDFLEIIKEVPDESVDLVLTDWPVLPDLELALRLIRGLWTDYAA